MYFGARLVILDEPTTALSLKEVKRVLEFIQALRDKGRSVLLVSHHVHQAYDVADRFLFMDKGRTVGEVRRVTSPCTATTIWLAMYSASTPRCGVETCVDLPCTRMRK